MGKRRTTKAGRADLRRWFDQDDEEYGIIIGVLDDLTDAERELAKAQKSLRLERDTVSDLEVVADKYGYTPLEGTYLPDWIDHELAGTREVKQLLDALEKIAQMSHCRDHENPVVRAAQDALSVTHRRRRS